MWDKNEKTKNDATCTNITNVVRQNDIEGYNELYSNDLIRKRKRNVRERIIEIDITNV